MLSKFVMRPANPCSVFLSSTCKLHALRGVYTAGAIRPGQLRIIHTSQLWFLPREAGADSDLSCLAEEQRKELVSGNYPADYLQEVIHLKTTECEFSCMLDRFRETRKLGQSVKLVFDKGLSTAKVLRYPTPVHQSIIHTPRRGIEEHLKHQNLEGLFLLETNSESTIRHKAREEQSEVISDLSLIYGNTFNPILVLVVGFSEKHEDLVQSARLWLDNKPTTKAVLLVRIDERPSYRSPLELTDYVSSSGSTSPIPMDPDINDFGVEDPRDPDGPLVLNQKRWVGRLSAFCEIWARNEVGDPVRKGDRSFFYGPGSMAGSLELDLNDLVPSPEGLENSQVVIDYQDLSSALGKARYRLAVRRCNRFISAFLKKKELSTSKEPDATSKQGPRVKR